MFTYDDFHFLSIIADYVLSLHFPSACTDINTIMNKSQTGSITQCCPETKTELDYCNMRVANWVANCVWWSLQVWKFYYSVSHPSQCVNCLSRSCVCEFNNIIGPQNWNGITLERRSTTPTRLIVRETIIVVDDAIIWFHRKNRTAVGTCMVNIRIIVEGWSADWDMVVEGGEMGHLWRDHDNSNLNWWREAVWKEKKKKETVNSKNTKQAGNQLTISEGLNHNRRWRRIKDIVYLDARISIFITIYCQKSLDQLWQRLR